MMPRAIKSEKDWQAEDDFRTIARAEEVKADKKRMSKAKKAGKRVVKEEKEYLKKQEKTVMNLASVAAPVKVKIKKPSGKTVTIKKGTKKPVKIVKKKGY